MPELIIGWEKFQLNTLYFLCIYHLLLNLCWYCVDIKTSDYLGNLSWCVDIKTSVF